MPVRILVVIKLDNACVVSKNTPGHTHLILSSNPKRKKLDLILSQFRTISPHSVSPPLVFTWGCTQLPGGGHRVSRHQGSQPVPASTRSVVALPACSPGSMPVAAATSPPFGPLQVRQPSFNATSVLFMKAHNEPAAPCVTLGPAVCLSLSLPRHLEYSFLDECPPRGYIGASVSRLPAELYTGGQAVGLSACSEGPTSGRIPAVPGPWRCL